MEFIEECLKTPVAGKTISGTHEAMASYRVTGDCAAMGEAAIASAAWALKHETDVRDVKIKEIMKGF